MTICKERYSESCPETINLQCGLDSDCKEMCLYWMNNKSSIGFFDDFDWEKKGNFDTNQYTQDYLLAELFCSMVFEHKP